MNSILHCSKWGRKLGKQLEKPIRKFKEVTAHNHWNIVTGDLVKVIEGPQVGQQGKIIAVLRAKNRVIIDSVNVV